MAEGLKVTLSGIGNGLTVDKNGRELLPKPFVFQCSPLEQYAIQYQMNMGTYDTIDNDQFMRRGSRQLNTWSFDTLAMYLGVGPNGHYQPLWVPHPTREPSGDQYHRPEWYRDQLEKLLDAGSPCQYVAAFSHSTTIHRCYAVLTAFQEIHKHGEGDSIYFASVSFTEWRDPGGESDKPKGTHHLPGHIRFRIGPPNNRYIAYDLANGRNIPIKAKRTGTTLMDLARYFYGDGSKWRVVASNNHLRGGGGNTPIFHHWYPHRISRGKPNVTMAIPKLPKPPPTTRTAPAKAKRKKK
jgi:hypothetical protein